MMKIGVPEVVKVKIPNTSQSVQEITGLDQNGLRYSGKLVLLDAGGRRENYTWVATYRGSETWLITGQGAIMGSGGRVPSPERFPFSTDSTVNKGVMDALSGWLNKYKSDAPLSGESIPARKEKKVADVVTPEPAKATAPARSVSPPPPMPATPPFSKPVAAEKIVIKLKRPEEARPAPEPVQPEQAIPSDPKLNGLLVVRVKVAEIQRYKGQPREEFDADGGESMGDSLRQEKQLSLITIKPIEGVPGKRWELVDGERRYNGAVQSNTEYLDAIVKVFKTEADQYWYSFTANWGRKGHTALETARALDRARRDGKSVKEIMVATGGRSIAWVTSHLSIMKLPINLQNLMKLSVPADQRLRFGVAQTLARVPTHENQLKIWEAASKEATPGLVKLKVEELCAPFIALLPKKGRVRRPSDRAERALRIIKTGETDVAFIDGLKDEDIKALVTHKNLGNQSYNLSKRVNAIIKKMQEFEKQIKAHAR